jgi:hypothetical protein
MGDHRAEVKIEFTIHGKTYKGHWGWINWFPSTGGCDERIIEWFGESWDDASARYDQMIWERGREAREKEEEEQDRKEYARLKEKFEEP